jgi:hypothetical protein|tara:strand:+ start:96 stop:494 length:399 start_codon:yes stop_codon:yes gene_type:complete
MNKLDDFIKENIPDDVLWKDKMIELVTEAYQLDRDSEIEDYELRVYGISNTVGLQEDVVHMPDEEWVEEAEQFGYISTLDTFMGNVNKGIVAKDYPHLQFKVIAIGKYKEEITQEKIVDIIPNNKLHYIIRD